MPKKGYQNKKIKAPETTEMISEEKVEAKKPQKSFHFPLLRKTVVASSYNEALSIVNKQ